MMRRLAERGVWAVVLVLGLAAAGEPLAAEPDIPLPQGVEALPEPYEVTMGATPLQIQGFTTTMSAEELRKFYEQALPKAGWQLELLPWQAHHARVQQDFQKTMTERYEAKDDPQMQEMEENLEQTSQALAHQLYARQGDYHLIVNMTTVGGRRTVFLNRWNGRASWMEMRPSGAQEADAEEQPTVPGQAPGWPLTNPCCSNESVSASEVQRILPTTVPPYPGARVIGTNRSASDDSRVVIMETPDDRAQVERFYQKQLAYNGWKPVAGPGGEALDEMALYEKDGTVCGLAFVSSPTVEEGTSGPSTLITIQVMEGMGSS